MIWRPASHRRFAQLADFITCILSCLIAYLIWSYLHDKFPSIVNRVITFENQQILLIILFSIIYLFIFNQFKAYSYQRFTSLEKEFLIVFKTNIIGFIISICILFITGHGSIPRTIFIVGFIVVTSSFLIQKTIMFKIASIIRSKGKDRKRILLIGTGTCAEKFISTVNNKLGWGLDIIGLVSMDEENIGREFYGKLVLGKLEDLVQILKKLNPDEVIITSSLNNFEIYRSTIEKCETEGVQVRIISDLFTIFTKEIRFDQIYGFNILSLSSIRQSEIQIYLKRIIDIIGAVFSLILFFPFMIIATMGILISDGRPILYEWNVIGINKKPFRSWKFRTMIKNADALKNNLLDKNEMKGPVFKIKNDPRIIPFGKWLRRWSIDETPQLFSVLKGDMSLVGPRPAGPHELERYESWQRRKLSIKPGITCLWQVRGRNKISNFDDWVKLDLEYIDNWSLWLDIWILFRTIPAVLFSRGAS